MIPFTPKPGLFYNIPKQLKYISYYACCKQMYNIDSSSISEPELIHMQGALGYLQNFREKYNTAFAIFKLLIMHLYKE